MHDYRGPRRQLNRGETWGRSSSVFAIRSNTFHNTQCTRSNTRTIPRTGSSSTGLPSYTTSSAFLLILCCHATVKKYSPSTKTSPALLLLRRRRLLVLHLLLWISVSMRKERGSKATRRDATSWSVTYRRRVLRVATLRRIARRRVTLGRVPGESTESAGLFPRGAHLSFCCGLLDCHLNATPSNGIATATNPRNHQGKKQSKGDSRLRRWGRSSVVLSRAHGAGC